MVASEAPSVCFADSRKAVLQRSRLLCLCLCLCLCLYCSGCDRTTQMPSLEVYLLIPILVLVLTLIRLLLGLEHQPHGWSPRLIPTQCHRSTVIE